jgi:hypothetical protein
VSIHARSIERCGRDGTTARLCDSPLSWGSPAGAPTISITVVTDGGVVNLSNVIQALTIGDGDDQQRLLKLVRPCWTDQQWLEDLLVEGGSERGQTWSQSAVHD